MSDDSMHTERRDDGHNNKRVKAHDAAALNRAGEMRAEMYPQ